MGTETKNEMEAKEEERDVIDVLYKDTYRINSFLAQLEEGFILSVKRQKTKTIDKNKNFEGSAKIAKYSHTSRKMEQNLLEYNIEQHDFNVLNLLYILDLEELEDLPEIADAKLVHLFGQLSIRNLKTYSRVIPTMANNPSFFKLDKTTARDMKKQADTIFSIIPLNIEMDLHLKSNITLRSIIKEEYLMSSYNNITATYGTNLPHKWHVIGILDNKANPNLNSTSQIRIALDSMNEIINSIISEGSANYSFIPILIFRFLNK